MSISKRKARSKRQKQRQKKAKKEQRKLVNKQPIRRINKILTASQKQNRAKLIADSRLAKEARRKRNKEKFERDETTKIRKAFLTIFDPETLDLLARKTGFIKKPGEITAIAFVYIVSFGFFGNGEIALTYLVAGLSTHFDIFVSPQALSTRINSKSAVKLLKSTLIHLMAIQLELGLKNKYTKTFSMFNGVFLQDSSQVSLNEHLAPDFKGSGGGASKSALKLDLIFNVISYAVCGVKIRGGSKNDQSFSSEILKHVKKGSLVLRDLGYFSLDTLRSISNKGAYYLSRLSMSTNVYLEKNDKEPANIIDHLKKLQVEGKDLSNIKVFIGKVERLETRLVAEKVPLSVIEKRKARYTNKHKKIPSDYFQEWSGYSLFVTNIPLSMFSGKMIIAMYKIRWQIEVYRPCYLYILLSVINSYVFRPSFRLCA
jgi:hypothetical protein